VHAETEAMAIAPFAGSKKLTSVQLALFARHPDNS